MKNAYFIPNIQFRAPKKIDPLRVSQSISKNMMKEINKDEYGAGTKVPTDINLANRDQEITIGKTEEDHSERNPRETDM